MPRTSRHRGKEIKKRGISKEQVCVATALDRQGNLIIELLCTGRMTSDELERLYGNRIGEHSINTGIIIHILCILRIYNIEQLFTNIQMYN